MSLKLGWVDLPRSFGTPYQTIVSDIDTLDKLIKEQNGKTPVFISHNRFGVVKDCNPVTIEVSKLFADLDSEDKPENALLDVRMLAQWCDKENLPWIAVYSGGKGFHFYLLFKPIMVYYSDNLCVLYRNILDWLTKELELRTICFHGSSPRRLCRVWYTLHVTETQPSNGRYCYPLKPEWVTQKSIVEIEQMSYNPPAIDPVNFDGKQSLTIFEFCATYGITETPITPTSDIVKSKICEFKGVTDKFILSLFPNKLCLQQAILSPNPKHPARFAITVWLKQLGYTEDWIFQFFQDRNYIDKHRIEACTYQIHHIFNKSPAYHFPSCKTLISQGLCVGKACNRYHG